MFVVNGVTKEILKYNGLLSQLQYFGIGGINLKYCSKYEPYVSLYEL